MADGSFRTAAALNVTRGSSPLDFSRSALPRLDRGELAVVVGSPERIEALVPIDAQSGVYLYNARTTEETMFNSWSRAQ